MKPENTSLALPAPGTPDLRFPLTESSPELLGFREKLEKLCNDHLESHFAVLAKSYRIGITFEFGPKYIRVVRADVPHDRDGARRYSTRSVHCFIERSNGTIWKPAGWKGPERKNPRGNVCGENPLQGLTEYGTIYLR